MKQGALPLGLVPRNLRAKALGTASHSVMFMTYFCKKPSYFRIHSLWVELCLLMKS